jgi:hypothetical protein
VGPTLSASNPPETSGRAIGQSLLTVIATVLPQQEAALKQLLVRLAAELPPHPAPAAAASLPFAEIPTIHFARWLVLEEASDLAGKRIDAQLVCSIVHDGPREAFLGELVQAAGKALHEIYAHCEGYHPGKQLADYLLEHVNEAAAFFVSARWRPALLVRGAAELRSQLEELLDAAIAEGALGESPAAIHRQLREAVSRSERLRWALLPAARPGLAARARHWGALAALALSGLVLLPLWLPALVVLLVGIRLSELREQRAAGTPGRGPSVAEARAVAKHVESLMTYSGFFVQNQLSLVSLVKLGRLRWLVMRIVLLYVRFRTYYLDVFGKLDGLPSVHFAQWNLIDDGRRLLFLSNYDGTWEAYLGDFVDFAYKGLNAIWSNVVGFPPTRWLAFGGASGAQEMGDFVGSQQVVCPLWWAAYPSLSVLNVENDIAIREGLAARALPDPAAWLQRL